MISLLWHKSRVSSQRLSVPQHWARISWARVLVAVIASSLIMADFTGLNSPPALGQSNPRGGSSLTHNKSATGNNFRGVVTQLKRSNRRWIEVRIRSQKLYAWQGDQLAFRSNVSAGKSDSPTPTGLFTIQSKHNVAPMRGEGYNIPDVPFVMYYDGNYAIHGAYWHRKFGVPISRGCVNLDPDQAARLFRWADVGTPIVIRE